MKYPQEGTLGGRAPGKRSTGRYRDFAGARSPYLWNSASRNFITYEDPQSLAIKRCYVRDMHLGGIMFWELSLDRNDELLDVIAGACKDQKR